MNQTIEKYAEFVASRTKRGEDILATMTPEKAHLLHMALGVSGESGEIVDTIKKHVIYGKPLDMQNMIEELGDLLFFIHGFFNTLGLEINFVLDCNVSKLTVRYKKAYSDEEAANRADKEESK